MATSKAQRIGIWGIAVLMVLSTVAMFVGMVLSTHNQSNDAQDQVSAEKQVEEYLASLEPLDGYQPEKFASSVTSLKVDELKPGTGAVVKEDSTITAIYFGWTPDGKIFDSTKKAGNIEPVDFPLSGVIKGWTQGLTGQREGAVVKLTIPAELAYGEQGSPPLIEPNTPLMFIVEIKKVQ